MAGETRFHKSSDPALWKPEECVSEASSCGLAISCNHRTSAIDAMQEAGDEMGRFE